MVETRKFHISWRLPHLTILFVANRLTNTRNRFDSKPLLAEGTGSPLRSSDTKTHAVAHSLTHAACRRPNDPSRRPAKHRTKSPPPSAGKATPRACHSFRFVLVRRVVCLSPHDLGLSFVEIRHAAPHGTDQPVWFGRHWTRAPFERRCAAHRTPFSPFPHLRSCLWALLLPFQRSA